jgi:parallel beta-helix repeat protein
MRPSLFAASFAVALAYGPAAFAATWFVSPSGTATSGCSSRAIPCSLDSATSGAIAGDTVVLMDGVYNTPLLAANSGTATAWITFQADECATPIIQGPGPAPGDDDQSTGVGSHVAEYLRFRGIVSRGWNMGFANAWTGSHTPDSNSHFEIEHCIAESNGRTGFTSFSAEGFRLRNSISAHNGSSTLHSWSSGVTLYASPGGVVENCVSFENVDAERHTDGNGFIVDETSDNAVLVNNIAFRNGGSCLRLTKSSGTTFINNTCYQNAQDQAATGPTNPSELYFTNASTSNTTTSVQFMNNVLVNTGQGPGAAAVIGQPATGWSNNVVMTGSVALFTGPDGDPPDFTLAAGATELIGKGAAGAKVPTDAIGFDPKCLAKGAPQLVGQIGTYPWWQNSVNFEYIKSIGGVAACFRTQTRAVTPDVGAYAAGALNVATPGACIPPAVDTPPPVPTTPEPAPTDTNGNPVPPATATSNPIPADTAGNPNPAMSGIPSGGVTPPAGTTNGAGMTSATPPAGDPPVGAASGSPSPAGSTASTAGGTPAPTPSRAGPVGSTDDSAGTCACAVPGRSAETSNGWRAALLGLCFAALGVLRRTRRR